MYQLREAVRRGFCPSLNEERSQKYREIRDSSHSFRMTKQRFVIGEFISVTMNEPMLFCFVIGEFISVTMNEPMLFVLLSVSSLV